ncbi:hypothetical protein G647_04438 [Cladophialophora carrionii CBS 160.54]|uniref:F-box domain-containing protein n=1 Tax=Cladophialophora carrionii CBS 160.54 TaxID=1279043 RepID=V9DFF9_9EURO|nr:uncharacterized protein G647_04438 [Cladophialophora carrionii CBS 160.54]ETI25068.1 hypothetical protein G647_04438 [Cladophialophora carrionii CBS 160.54]
MHLPDELLGQIFMHVDTHDVDQKFRLSQVCSQWRKAALGLRQMWNRMSIMTPQDGHRLPLLLERSGSAALDVELLWQHRYQEPMLTSSERVLASTSLGGCRDRLQRLFVDVNRMETQQLSPLLAAGLSFPVLENLEIQSSYNRPQALRLSFLAPQLRRLRLYQMDAVNWGQLLARSLTHVHLEKCFGADLDLLETIFKQCAQLQSLTVRMLASPVGFWDLETPVAQLVPRLRALDLSADVTDLITILRTGFRGLLLDELTTETYNGHMDEETTQLLAEVFMGIDPLHSLQCVDDQDMILHDASGRMRRMRVWNEDSSWIWPDVWIELADRHRACDTMKKFRIRSFDWNDLAGAFSERPPLAEDIEVHVDLASNVIDDPYNFEYDDPPVPELEKFSRGLRYLKCQKLGRIVFTDNENYEGNSNINAGSRAQVIHTLLDALVCESPVVEVCLSQAGLEKPTKQPYEEVPIAIQTLLDTKDKYVLCRHCATVLSAKQMADLKAVLSEHQLKAIV